MANLEWAHALAAIIGAVIGAATAIFGFGWRMGRIEGRLAEKFKESIEQAEKRIELKVDDGAKAFDETLKGLRQKINDVEKDGLLRFLPKEEFTDFRAEYREDMRDLKALIRNGNQG